MDTEAVRSLTLAVHILSVVVVLCTVCTCVALTLVSRPLEAWLPSLVLALRRDRVKGAERH